MLIKRPERGDHHLPFSSPLPPIESKHVPPRSLPWLPIPPYLSSVRFVGPQSLNYKSPSLLPSSSSSFPISNRYSFVLTLSTLCPIRFIPPCLLPPPTPLPARQTLVLSTMCTLALSSSTFHLWLIICYQQQSHGGLVYRQRPGRGVHPPFPFPPHLASLTPPVLPASARQCAYSSPRCPQAPHKPSPRPRAHDCPAPTRAPSRTHKSSSTLTALSQRPPRASTTSSRTREPSTEPGWASPVSGFSRPSSERRWVSDGRPLARPRTHLHLLTATFARRYRVRKKRSTRAAGATSKLHEPKLRTYVLR